MDKDTRNLLKLMDTVDEVKTELHGVEKILGYKTIGQDEKLDRIHKITTKLLRRIND